ncbi:MAG: hypothetical protein GQ537_10320 [Gammaproteobacteria bacterium]|nr:hypothetical protein [Gammaproteobacteria bacterium]
MTLSRKLIMPVVLGYGLLAGALYFIWAPQQLDQSRTLFLEQQQLVLQSLHTLINDAVLQEDIAEIDLRLNQAWQSYETNWHYLLVEQQTGEPLYSAGVLADETTPFSTTIREPFLRKGYQIATLRADVDWSLLAAANHQSTMHAEMLLLFVFMVVVVASLAITEIYVMLPMMRLKHAIEHPEEEDPGIASPSSGNDETSQAESEAPKTHKDSSTPQ